jgi:hypothetical protein
VNCGAFVNAADIVGSIAGLGDPSLCGNGDCDRDGNENQVADVECTVGCTFGQCPVPPHAPRVRAVAPETRSEVTAYAGIVITGDSFGSPDRPKRVTIGGVDVGPVLFEPPDTILVSVPPVEPGERQVVVFDGDLAGASFPLTVADADLTGTPGTFEETHELLSDAFEAFAQLDLQEAFGDDGALLLQQANVTRAAIDDFLVRLSMAEDVTGEVRETLDAAARSSGLPASLRELITELQALSSAGDGGAASIVMVAGPARQLGNAARFVAAMSQLGIRVAVPATTAAEALGVAGLVFAEGLAVLTAAAVIHRVLVAAGTPVITDMQFFDAEGQPSVVARAGGTVRIGARLVDLIPGQVVLEIFGNSGIPIRREPERTGFEPTFLEFRFPLRIGLCDRVLLKLVGRIGGFESNIVSVDLYPQLLDILGPNVERGEIVELEVTGALGCNSVVAWSFSRFDEPFFTTGSELRPIGDDPPASLVRTTVPNLPQGPGEVFVELTDRALQSNRLPITFSSGVTGATVSCPSNVELGEPLRCSAAPLPTSASFPADVRVAFSSSNQDVAVAPIDLGPTAQNIETTGLGSVEIGAIVYSGGFILVAGAQSAAVEVVDRRAPRVRLRSDPGQPAIVRAGDVLELTATAEDGGSGVGEIQVSSTGDAVESVQQAGFCSGTETCAIGVRVRLREEAFSSLEVFVRARAMDVAGNESTSSAVSFLIRDDQAPALTVSGGGASPLDPGAMLVFDVEAEDDIQVARIEAEIVGDAATTPDGLFLCPAGSGSARCATSVRLNVRQSFADRDFAVRFSAFDRAGNAATAMREFTVNVQIMDVSGTVRHEIDRDPIEGATVFLLDSQRNVLAETSSMATGRFVFTQVSGDVKYVLARLDGFLPAEAEVVPDGAIVLGLVPIDGDTLTVSGTVRIQGMSDPNGTVQTPTGDATVTVFDRDLAVVGIDVSAADGTYRIDGVPRDEYIVRVAKPEFAVFSRHRPVNGPHVVNAVIYPANPFCASEAAGFEVTRGTTLTNHVITFFGEATFATPGQTFIDPAGAILCVAGNAVRPTFDWSEEALAQIDAVPRSLQVREFVSFGTGRRIFYLRDPGGNPLSAPIVYGDPSEGTIEPPLEDLVPGVAYTLQTFIDSEARALRAELTFRVRP